MIIKYSNGRSVGRGETLETLLSGARGDTVVGPLRVAYRSLLVDYIQLWNPFKDVLEDSVGGNRDFGTGDVFDVKKVNKHVVINNSVQGVSLEILR